MDSHAIISYTNPCNIDFVLWRSKEMGKDLGLVQMYWICAVNEKGKISQCDPYKETFFVAAALLQLQQVSCIKMKDSKIFINGFLPNDKKYLSSLYEWIKENSPVKMTKLIDKFTMSFSGKKLDELERAVASLLIDGDYVRTITTGVFHQRERLVPTTESIEGVICELKEELLQGDVLRKDMVALVSLCYQAGFLKKYLTKQEVQQVKGFLKTMKESKEQNQIRKMLDYTDSMLALCTVAAVI